MKTPISFLLLGLVLLCGCSRRYTIVTNGGSQIAVRGKPHLEHGAYVYKDSRGRRTTIPAGRVREIAPSSMVDSDINSTFGNSR